MINLKTLTYLIKEYLLMVDNINSVSLERSNYISPREIANQVTADLYQEGGSSSAELGSIDYISKLSAQSMVPNYGRGLVDTGSVEGTGTGDNNDRVNWQSGETEDDRVNWQSGETDNNQVVSQPEQSGGKKLVDPFKKLPTGKIKPNYEKDTVGAGSAEGTGTGDNNDRVNWQSGETEGEKLEDPFKKPRTGEIKSNYGKDTVSTGSAEGAEAGDNNDQVVSQPEQSGETEDDQVAWQ